LHVVPACDGGWSLQSSRKRGWPSCALDHIAGPPPRAHALPPALQPSHAPTLPPRALPGPRWCPRPGPHVRPSSNHPVKLGSYSSSRELPRMPTTPLIAPTSLVLSLSISRTQALPPSLFPTPVSWPLSARRHGQPASSRQRVLWSCSVGVEVLAATVCDGIMRWKKG
jgi:hypothetical protein